MHKLVDKNLLKSSLQRAAILSNEQFKGVKLNITNNSMKIIGHNPEQEQAEEIVDIESDIEDIHSKMKTISEENDVLYKEVETIDHTLSDIDNNIEESEWKVELDSPEEKVFELVKNKLIINKRLKYGDI